MLNSTRRQKQRPNLLLGIPNQFLVSSFTDIFPGLETERQAVGPEFKQSTRRQEQGPEQVKPGRTTMRLILTNPV